MQFSPTSCHFISLRCKYSPQHPVLKHLQWLGHYPFQNKARINQRGLTVQNTLNLYPSCDFARLFRFLHLCCVLKLKWPCARLRLRCKPPCHFPDDVKWKVRQGGYLTVETRHAHANWNIRAITDWKRRKR
jgi:hypothetical protein